MEFQTTNCVAISVSDMRAACDHYAQVLGFETVKEHDQWIEVKSGGLRLFLCQDDPPLPPTFNLRVPSVEGALEHLLSNGWSQVDLGEGEVFVRDPFGSLFALSQGGSESESQP
jgi:hypothetical protein